MKKIFSFVAIAAVAATMFTGCSKDDDAPVNGGGQVKLTLSAAPTTVAVGAEGEFTVTSDIAAPEAITVTVTSSAAATLTVDPASVIIAKGEKTAKGKFKGVADGKAKITIAASGVTLSVPSVDITVGKSTPSNAEIKMLDITQPDWPGFELFSDETYFNFYEIGYDQSAGIGSIAMDLVKKGTPMGMGNVDSNGFLCLSAQPEGTAIKLDAMSAPTNDRPIVWSSTINHTALATGEDVYIAVACGDYDNTSDDYRAWVKINIKAAGGWSSINVIEAAICLTPDAEFKVGQKE